ncbi:MAG: hypothetical protein HOO86_14355 [Bacteroidales bacterium]|nr:hypothetical protein [Bacteroidales bacterium]
MKKLIVLIAVAVSIALSGANAENLPSIATKVPAPLKRKILKSIDYSGFTEQNKIEGDVLLEFTVSKESKLEIVGLSASDQVLGAFVKKELTSLVVENSGMNTGQIYYLKIKFDLLTDH